MGNPSQYSSLLDPIVPPLFNALILCFPCLSTEGEAMAGVLQESLSMTVHERPYVAGEVNDMTQPGHGWGYSYVELREAGMPVGKLDGAFLAPLSGYNTTTKVMAARANLIEGGFLLSVYFLHSFVDAFGASLVMGTWAENCRKVQSFASPPRTPRPSLAGAESTSASLARLIAPKTLQLPSVLDKTSLSPPLRQEEYERLKKRPELWKVLGLDWRPLRRNSAPPFQNTSSISTSIFSATPTALSKLKRDASPVPVPLEAHDGTKAAGWISTKDALAALLWRCIMKARFPSQPVTNIRVENYKSVIAVAMDGRKSLGIPIDYVGNVVFESMTELDISTLTSPETSLAAIATILRASLERSKSSNLLNDAVALASCIPDVRSLAYAIPDWVGKDLILTSWVDMPYYEHVWGPIFGETGKAEFFGMPKGQFEGICSVQPRQPNGKVEVVIGLEVEQMERLRADREFSQYLAYESS